MEKVIDTYLTNLTNMLGGNLRGAINAKAKELNTDLIRMSLNDAFEKGKEYGMAITTEEYAIQNLKNQIKDDQPGDLE